MGRVVVVGSSNVDTAVSVVRQPQPGETVIGAPIGVGPGGKGLNQAVAAARAGAEVLFVGATGEDPAAAMIRESLRECGAAAVLASSREPTGSAYVMVSASGENAIVVVPGANGDEECLTPVIEESVSGLGVSDLVLAQLEVPVASVLHALKAARRVGAMTVLNAAPSTSPGPELLGLIDVLIVNEHECVSLVPDASGVADAAQTLARSATTVIVTLGEDGCLIVTASEKSRRSAFAVAAVDTTAAGDTFCGALCAELARRAPLGDGVEFAMAAAAITVQRHGAVASIPHRAEAEALLALRQAGDVSASHDRAGTQ